MMIKNALIAILMGALLVRILPAETLTGAATFGTSLAVYVILLWLEDLWDKNRKRIVAHIRWCGIRARELLGRRQRRKRVQSCVETLCSLQLLDRNEMKGGERDEEDHLYLRQVQERD